MRGAVSVTLWGLFSGRYVRAWAFGLYRVFGGKFGLSWPRLRRGAGGLLQVFEAAAGDSIGSGPGFEQKGRAPQKRGPKLAGVLVSLFAGAIPEGGDY